MLRLLLILLSISSFLSIAQIETEFRIYHKMGSVPYAWNSPFTNNLGESFKVTRLQYYVTKFTVIHDGGQETIISEDTVSLIKTNNSHTKIPLGLLAVTNVEGIKFHIGVHAPTNNGDPSLYPPTHPLAPQNPSMHWGWASGYRFLAYEGVAGNNYSQTFQLHCLGNHNYHEQTVLVNGQLENGKLIIAVDGDYIRGLDNISLANGVIAHGDDLQDQDAIENFRDYVFSARTEALDLSVNEVTNEQLKFSPNPLKSGESFTIDTELELSELILTDLSGKMILEFNVSELSSINLPVNVKAGAYLLMGTTNDGGIFDQKIIVIE